MLFSASTGLYALCNTDVFTGHLHFILLPLLRCRNVPVPTTDFQTVSEREKRDERLRERGSWSGGGILAVRKRVTFRRKGVKLWR
jgi:hypothetical protein